LNLSMELHKAGILQKYGVEMIGAKPDAIRKGEDARLSAVHDPDRPRSAEVR